MIPDETREFLLRELRNSYDLGKRDGIIIVAESLESVLDKGLVELGPGATAEDGFRAAAVLARHTLTILGLEDDKRG